MNGQIKKIVDAEFSGSVKLLSPLLSTQVRQERKKCALRTNIMPNCKTAAVRNSIIQHFKQVSSLFSIFVEVNPVHMVAVGAFTW